MTQDFAKIRPEPLLEKKPASNPPAWSLMITGVVLGITIGVFACVPLYLSGRVPPLSQPAVASAELANRASADSEPGTPAESDPAETAPEYEFYRELQEYEVLVDATPVDLSAQDPNRRLEQDYLLQTGAFATGACRDRTATPDCAWSECLRQRPGIVGRSLFSFSPALTAHRASSTTLKPCCAATAFSAPDISVGLGCPFLSATPWQARTSPFAQQAGTSAPGRAASSALLLACRSLLEIWSEPPILTVYGAQLDTVRLAGRKQIISQS